MNSAKREGFFSFLQKVRDEIGLLEKQIARSRAARGVAINSPTSSVETGTTPAEDEAAKPRSQPSPSPVPVSPDGRRGNGPEGAVTPRTVPTAGPAVSGAVSMPTRKEGYLLHLAGFNDSEFLWHYFVVDAGGVRWYESEERAHQQQPPRKPLGTVGFSLTTANSRGSVFRKAAVCWPLILPEDCPPVAKDPSKTYFAIDYYVPQGFGASFFSGGSADSGGVTAKKLFLGATSVEERDEWVTFLRQYIDVYLAPRAESEELQYLIAPRHVAGDGSVGRGSVTRPLHRSEVIDGEAPGGNYL